MSPKHRNLVHKEWRDRRSSFILCCSWLVICAGYSVAYEVAYRSRTPVASFYGCCLTYSLFAAVVLASKTALSEKTQGTLNFSLALPLSRKTLASLRLIGGIGTLFVPIVVGGFLLTPVLIS